MLNEKESILRKEDNMVNLNLLVISGQFYRDFKKHKLTLFN